MEVELLAPAGNVVIGISAINFGADAVYIGASAFSARKNAGNSLFDIEKLINHAHKYKARVHIALNTILNDEELIEAQKLAFKLSDIGADALIIQDMGLVELGLPKNIELHASTQCNIRTLDKVKFFEKMGFSRAILARELSLDEIKNIKENTSIKLETFIHGALCTSYSGQCYMSAYIGERSANRGDCAQACRKKYSLIQNDKILFKKMHLLSLKDFCAEKYIDELVKIGVSSFKIEGRLKDINYVKNVVLYYRKLLDKYEKTSVGNIYSDFEPNINKTFNRGYTSYFLSGKREKIANFNTPKSMGEYIGDVSFFDGKSFKLNKKIKINPQDGLCFIQNGELTGFLANKEENGKIYPNKKTEFKIGDKIYRNKDVEFENKLKNSKTKRLIDIKLSVFENEIVINDKEFETSIKYQGEIANSKEKAKESFKKAFEKVGDGIFKTTEIIFKTDNIPYLPISKLNSLREEIFKSLEDIRIKNYKKEDRKEIINADFPNENKDYRLNIHNKISKEFYEKSGVFDAEYSLEKTRNFKNKELMRMKYCIRNEIGQCLKKGGNKAPLFLIDEKGEKFRFEFDCKKCESVILPAD